MALFGKFCVSAVFSVSLLFISEIYPTSIRNTGLGTSLTISQIGAVIAPYVVELLVMLTTILKSIVISYNTKLN